MTFAECLADEDDSIIGSWKKVSELNVIYSGSLA
jgi:hypothetical protein